MRVNKERLRKYIPFYIAYIICGLVDIAGTHHATIKQKVT